MKIFRGAAFIALVCLMSSVAQAQVRAPEFTIWGRLIMPEGYFSRQSGIEVRLERPGRIVMYSVATDEDGRFQFRNLEGGGYVIYVNLEGFVAVMEGVSLTRGAHEQANVTIHLRRGAGDSTIDGTGKASDKPKELVGKAVVIDAETLKKYSQKIIRDYEEALKEADNGKHDKASDRLKKVVASAPDFYDAQLQLGLAFQRTNRLKDAEDAFRRARSIRPRAAQPLINIAGVTLDKVRAGDSPTLYNVVVKLAEEAIELEPDSAEAHYYLGSALFKLSDLTRAEDALRRSLGIEKPIEDARLMLVNVYMKHRRYREALDQLDRYIELNPNSPQRKAIEDLQAQIRRSLNQ